MSALLGANRIPAHLPERLAITLWDFSWYTRAGAGEPYADLDAAFRDAVHRGYNAIRICAAPLLTFGDLGLATTVEVSGLGEAPVGYYGQRTRWYDVVGGYRLDVRQRLLELFDAARRHDVVVILSSWEYQQSSSLAADDRWWRAIDGVPFDLRYRVLADAWDRLLSFLAEHGHDDRVAFVELHNEVDFSMLPPFEAGGGMALERLRASQPGVLVTASWGKPPHLDMAALDPRLGVAQFHVYAYGVLDALQQRIDLRERASHGFPNAALRALLRADAPEFAAYGSPAPWRLAATVITEQMIYGYDWVDADRWDLWLYEHYGEYRVAMHDEIRDRLTAVAAWSARHGTPMVVGEGWVGYTPLEGTFEEGVVGRELAETGITDSVDLGAWGVVACSNAAPHHPMWADITWQRRATSLIRG